MPYLNSQNGFTLIEVLVSILITSVALLGLIAMQARGIGSSIDAEERNQAALLADEMVATMWLQGTNDKDDLGTQITAWTNKVKAAITENNVDATVSDVDANGAAKITIVWTPARLGATQHSYYTQVVM